MRVTETPSPSYRTVIAVFRAGGRIRIRGRILPKRTGEGNRKNFADNSRRKTDRLIQRRNREYYCTACRGHGPASPKRAPNDNSVLIAFLSCHRAQSLRVPSETSANSVVAPRDNIVSSIRLGARRIRKRRPEVSGKTRRRRREFAVVYRPATTKRKTNK